MIVVSLRAAVIPWIRIVWTCFTTYLSGDAANNAFRYSTTIQESFRTGVNKVDYPNNSLSEQLSIVAKLIKGRLGTRVFMVSIGGFDTHAEQADTHPRLMNNFGTAVKAFMDDLDTDQLGDKVLGMTFSEFGRTIHENGSLGTDHGTGTPVLLFGGQALGNGFVGEEPDLINTGQFGDPDFDVDFRDVYATVLENWLGADSRMVDHVLGDRERIDNLVPEGDFPEGMNANKSLLGYRYANDGENIEVKYALTSAGITEVNLLNTNGTLYRNLVSSAQPLGAHTYLLDKEKDQVQASNYKLELKTGGRTLRRHILIK